MNNDSLDYKQAGVDIDAANRSVELIKQWVEKTHRPGVLSGIGGFGGFFALDTSRYAEPVLVSGTDGVGTKLKIAQMMDIHHTVGIDLVAMCVNDILVHGAEPLFFLDYIAVGKLKPSLVEQLVQGVSEGCLQAGCALIGGETAEMPGFYNEDEYDLAGFAVGVVERSRLLTGQNVEEGDLLIGLPSSGVHSNGYSLARKALLERAGLKLEQYSSELGKTIGEELLTPTRIYVKPILKLLQHTEIKAMAHITGGGIVENLQRSLPTHLGAQIDSASLPVLPVFDLIAHAGQIDKQEMYRTFNMGIVFIVIASAHYSDNALKCLRDEGENPIVIGRVCQQGEGVVIK
ncbi:MAG: phosphoribosylformylglycinamidine cyclo-ligase [Bacillota bacterium]|nr:phosphoribosylformylglycinamidine cyclo-ligase [Bacillota bacterium]